MGIVWPRPWGLGSVKGPGPRACRGTRTIPASLFRQLNRMGSVPNAVRLRLQSDSSGSLPIFTAIVRDLALSIRCV